MRRTVVLSFVSLLFLCGSAQGSLIGDLIRGFAPDCITAEQQAAFAAAGDPNEAKPVCDCYPETAFNCTEAECYDNTDCGNRSFCQWRWNKGGDPRMAGLVATGLLSLLSIGGLCAHSRYVRR